MRHTSGEKASRLKQTICHVVCVAHLVPILHHALHHRLVPLPVADPLGLGLCGVCVLSSGRVNGTHVDMDMHPPN